MLRATRGMGTSGTGAHSEGWLLCRGIREAAGHISWSVHPIDPRPYATTPQFSILNTWKDTIPHPQGEHKTQACSLRTTVIGSGMSTWPRPRLTVAQAQACGPGQPVSQPWSLLETIRKEAVSFSTRMLMSLEVSLELPGANTQRASVWRNQN